MPSRSSKSSPAAPYRANSNATPPKPPLALLRLVAFRDGDEGYLGDLEERYAMLTELSGPATARRWLRREVIRALPRFIVESIRWRIEMFKNYVQLAFRILKKQKGYSFISISGMAAGMAACLLIFMYVSRELSYDRHQPAHDRVFRIAEETKSASSTQRYAPTPFPLAPAVLQDFPDVEAAARVLSASDPLLESGDKKFYEKRILLVDGDIFKILSLPLIQGNAKTALDRPNTIVVTERAARKFFGLEKAMGKIVKLNNNRLFEITGVLKDPTSPSHLSADWFASLSTLKQIPGWKDEFNNWHGTQVHTYIKLKPGVDAAAFEKRVAGIADKYVGSQLKALGSGYRFFLQPVARIHLESNLLFELDPPGSAGVLSLLSAAAAFILIIACLNFVGLATARAARRAREVGLRKVVGAERTQLIIQFLGESVVIALLGVLAAVILAALSLRIFNRLAGTEFTPAMLLSAGPLLFMGAMGLAAGLGAGSYPALVLSAFQPVRTLKGIFRTGRQGILTRQILVVGQVILSVVLIAGTAVIGGQIRFMKNQDLGYSKEQLLVLPVQGSDALQKRYEAVKSAFLAAPGVRGAAVSSVVPGRRGSSFNVRFVEGGADHNWGMYHLFVDADFIRLYKIGMAAGRPFERDMPTDETKDFNQAPVFLVNEAAVAAFGLARAEDAVGKKIETGYGGREGAIIGVVKNFHYSGLRNKVEPLIMEWFAESFGTITLKVAPGNLRETVAAVEKVWKTLFPALPFQSYFLDEFFNRQYAADEQVLGITRAFTLLGILISCLGLFGLASYLAEQRTKEIGVRKALGATTPGLAALFSSGFIRLVLLANLIAAPLAWYAMRRWLEGYASRAPISPWVFVESALLSVGVAVLSVGYQSIKAALTNPADSLKYE